MRDSDIDRQRELRERFNNLPQEQTASKEQQTAFFAGYLTAISTVVLHNTRSNAKTMVAISRTLEEMLLEIYNVELRINDFVNDHVMNHTMLNMMKTAHQIVVVGQEVVDEIEKEDWK